MHLVRLDCTFDFGTNLGVMRKMRPLSYNRQNWFSIVFNVQHGSSILAVWRESGVNDDVDRVYSDSDSSELVHSPVGSTRARCSTYYRTTGSDCNETFSEELGFGSACIRLRRRCKPEVEYQSCFR
jgi:hypothetical protein